MDIQVQAISLDDFIAGLYLKAFASGFIELRAIGDKGVVGREWLEWPGRLALPKKLLKHNVYWGVSLRNEEGKNLNKAEKTFVIPTHLVYCEFDIKGTLYAGGLDVLDMSPGELRGACELLFWDLVSQFEELSLLPAAIVYSGHGLQIYWKRQAASSNADTERFNTGLVRLIGADPSATDCTRILRVPGTLNHKNPHRPLPVELWYWSPETVVANATLEQFAPSMAEMAEQSSPAKATTTSYSGGKISEHDIATLTEAWGDVHSDNLNGHGRHSLALYTAGWLRSNGYSVEDATATIRGIAEAANDNNLADRLKAVKTTYARTEAPVGGWRALTEKLGLKLEGITLPPSKAASFGSKKAGSNATTTRQAAAPRGYSFLDWRDIYLDHLEGEGTHLVYNERSQSWWRYENGVYCDVPLPAALRWLDKALEAAGHDLSEDKLRGTLAKVGRVDGIHRQGEDTGPRELNVQNGILNLETLVLQPHSPSFFSTVQTGCPWNPEALADEWQAFLEFAVPDQTERYVIQQYAGYCLTADTGYQTALFLIGEGRTGKGTLARTIMALLGGSVASSYATGVSFEALEDGGHLLPTLVGKRLGVVSEIAKGLDWLTFKRITGEDAVLINEKHKAAYSTRLCCKLLLLANTMPYLGEDSTNSSVVRRLITVGMNQQPADPDRHLEARLTAPTALAGVLRWAQGGLHSLWAGEGFHRPTGNLNAEIMAQSNRVITWIEDRCDFSATGKLGAQDAYDDYREWCAHNGLTKYTLSLPLFKPAFLAAAKFWSHEIQTKKGNSGNRYEGISLRYTGLKGSQ